MTKQLRIAYLCGTNGWGGLEMNQLKNAIWMQERSHFVKIYCLENSPIHKATLENNLPFGIIQKHKNHYDFIKAFILLRLLKKDKVEHLIFRATFDQSIAATISFLSHRKIKVHYFMEMEFGAPKKQFFRTLRYSYFDSWNCPLEYLKKQVLENSKVKSEKVNVIPSGLDFDSITQNSKTQSRNLLKLPEDDFLFGIVGRIDQKKGQLLALKAIAQLEEYSFTLIIVGEETPDSPSSYLKEIKAFIEAKNLEEKVIFLPFQKNPMEVFNAFDWTLMTSDSETFGMVTIESMAQGTPVIGSNTGGTPELLHFGKLGLLYETKNVFDLAEKMKIALKNRNLFDHSILQQAIRKFNFNEVCLEVERVIQPIIKI
jgi:glycosyltransferase involved in cell wall biosynthesis